MFMDVCIEMLDSSRRRPYDEEIASQRGVQQAVPLVCTCALVGDPQDIAVLYGLVRQAAAVLQHAVILVQPLPARRLR